jgi:3-deoxy-7-phosphoheptulonate synthase
MEEMYPVIRTFRYQRKESQIMVVVLEEHVAEQDIERIIQVLKDFEFEVYRSTGVKQTVLGAIGVKPDFDLRQLEVMPGVASVYPITEPFKLASRSFKPENSVFEINGLKIGGKDIVVMAGPCSIESEQQIFIIAEHIAKQGARFLRGGAYKPRTSPYSFQGLGEDGRHIWTSHNYRSNGYQPYFNRL